MQKAETQRRQTQSQPAARQGKGVALESPQGEQIAQLEAMVGSSSRAATFAQLKAAAKDSLATAAQRRMMDTIRQSPRVAAQCKALEGLHHSPRVTAERRQLDGSSGEPAQREEAGEPVQPKVAPREQAPAKPNNTGLPDNLKNGVEALSGLSMDSVRVHYNSSQPAQLKALAYAQGTDIHVARGQEQHLPHEVWHVVQQAQGRAKPTMQTNEGVPVCEDKSLEREADVMGERAAAAEAVQEKSMEAAPADSKTAQCTGMPIGLGSAGPQNAVMMRKDPALAEIRPRQAGWTATKVVKPKNGPKGIFRFPMNGDNIDTFVGTNNPPGDLDAAEVPGAHHDAQKTPIPTAVADHNLGKAYEGVSALDADAVGGGDRGLHFRHADAAWGTAGARPDKYTWHHKAQFGHMELVDMNVHGAFWHYGGVAGWDASIVAPSDDNDDAGGTS